VKNTVIRLKRETSKSLYSTATNNGLVGFLLKISVDVSHNIDPNIFVMQRDVANTYTAEPIDTFYSIASVGELEMLSVNSPNSIYNNFYRTNYIELMFETPQELESAWKSISSEVRDLIEANDLSINTEPDVIAAYPIDAFLRYFGTSAVSNPTETSIKNLNSDSGYGVVPEILGSSIDVGPNSGEIELYQPEYYYFATSDLTAQPFIYVDGNLQTLTTFNLNIVNKYGLSIPYKIFRTQSTLNIGIHLVDVKKSA
jgi:hypothetical protein